MIVSTLSYMHSLSDIIHRTRCSVRSLSSLISSETNKHLVISYLKVISWIIERDLTFVCVL